MSPAASGGWALTRRTVLRATALGAAAVVTGCTGDTSPTTTTGSTNLPGPGGTGSGGTASTSAGPSGARSSPPSGPAAADWRALERSIDGDVVRRHDPGFATASDLFNTRFDAVRPLAVVEATSPEDVSEAVGFARRFGLRARGRSGGHPYVGASTVRDGLVIDVGRIRSVRYQPDSKIAGVGAGARLYAVHAGLARHGRTIPTGTCPTVGAAGLTLGGGVGVASREHGLTCDQLTGVTIVTADGRVHIANADHHPGLFWACRGGGGGTVGIVTSLRFRTQPARRTGFFLLSFPWSRAPAVIRGWARRVHSMQRSGVRR